MPQCTASGVDAQGAWTCERQCRGRLDLCQGHYQQRHLDKPMTRLPKEKRKRKKVERHDPQDMLCRIPEGHQRCGKCETIKPLDAFAFASIATGEKATTCKTCMVKIAMDCRFAPGAFDYKTATLVEQGGVCANKGCGKSIDGPAACLDHNHTMSKDGSDPASWRGVLCPNCNTLIGHAYEDLKVLLGAIDYLRSHGSP